MKVSHWGSQAWGEGWPAYHNFFKNLWIHIKLISSQLWRFEVLKKLYHPRGKNWVWAQVLWGRPSVTPHKRGARSAGQTHSSLWLYRNLSTEKVGICKLECNPLEPLNIWGGAHIWLLLPMAPLQLLYTTKLLKRFSPSSCSTKIFPLFLVCFKHSKNVLTFLGIQRREGVYVCFLHPPDEKSSIWPNSGSSF